MIDPTIGAILRLSERAGPRDPASFGPDPARAALRAFTVSARSPASVAAVRAVEDLFIDAGGTKLPVRVYRPDHDRPAPTVVYFHGGGFVTGDLDTHDNHCRWLTRESGAVVASVGYRLAPEHPFPAAVHDCAAAIRWAAAAWETLGGLPDQLSVAGDSAGGNLAAVVTQICRDEGGPVLRAQLLTYPVMDMASDAGYPSRRQYAEGFLLTAEAMRWFRSCYLTDKADRLSPLVSPLLGDLAGLPPAVVVTAELDPLRDEGEAYAAALAAAGVPVVSHRFEGLVHGSFELPLLPPPCVEAMRVAFGSFRTLLTRACGGPDEALS